MSYPGRRRSISPQSREPDIKGGFGISKIFGFLKPKESSHQTQHKQHDEQRPFRNQKELSIIETDPLLNNFSTGRKRTLSQADINNIITPRSSTLNTNFGMYQSYYDNLKNESEILNNDVEKRLSHDYGNDIAKASVNPLVKLQQQDRDDSPMSDLYKRLSPVLEDNDNENENDDQDKMPIIIEHEFAPLYKDSNGNLVRPPFINLDPRERHHVLQLKKSIQASEALQNRIKYMVNPKETQSTLVANSNKVETATQTHDLSYLENSLNFRNLKRRLLEKKQGTRNKRAKNGKGYFVGEFLYDDIEKKEEINSSSKLHGYLGTINKPRFDKNDSKTEKIADHIKPNQDESQFFNRFSGQNIKSTETRTGLDNSLLHNKKVNVLLDPDYIQKSENLSNLIKLKDDNSSKTKDKQSVQPSSGFNFSINSNDITSIIDKRHEDEALVSKSNELLNKDDTAKTNEPAMKRKRILGDDDKTKEAGSGFSFDSTNENKDTPKPLFSFDGAGTKESGDSKPSFSFGASNSKENSVKPTFTFGAKKEAANTLPPLSDKDSNKLAFSFGPLSSSKEEPKGGLSFGESTQKKEEPKTTVTFGGVSEKKEETAKSLSFGSSSEKKDDQTPASTFGGASGEKEGTKPTFSFGAATKKEETNPSFAFGGASEKKDDAAKPAFTFGTTTEKKDDSTKPTFLLGASEKKDDAKPALSFGTANAKKAESVKPAFSFGAESDLKESPKPLFTFGGAEKKEDTPKPVAFGATSNSNPVSSTPAFTFGASSEKKDAPKPAFTFSATSNNEKTPFSLSAQTPAPTLGQTSKSQEATPKPLDKPATTFASNNSTPNFNFGASREATPKPNFAFASGTNANPSTSGTPGQSNNNLFNFTGTVSNEGTPDPASIFGGSNANMNPMNGGNTPATTSFAFGGAPQHVNNGQNFMNSAPSNFNSTNNGMQNQRTFSPPAIGTAGTPQSLSTTPPLVKSNRKIAQMRLRRR